MSDLISREIAIKELREYADIKCNNGYIDTANGILTAMTWIKNMTPAVDAVEVVRCKDCKHQYEEFFGIVCVKGVCVDCIVPEDFYCPDGEQKEVS